VQSILNRFILIQDKATPMYKKNLGLAILHTTFQSSAVIVTPGPEHQGATPRVVQLGLYLDQYFDKLSAFDDVKDYVAQLSFQEAKALIDVVLAKMLEEVCVWHVSNCPKAVR